MPPRALPPITRTVNVSTPQRGPGSAKPATSAPRQVQVLQTGRAPAQLSLFLRPSGAR
jgi:hypothetical protein